MYPITDLAAIESAEAALAAVAEHFALAARSTNGTSLHARKEAALRVQALEALEALATIDAGDSFAPEPTDWTPTPLGVLAASLPPLVGGAPCYEPTAADLDEYERWLDSLPADRRAFHERVRDIHEGFAFD